MPQNERSSTNLPEAPRVTIAEITGNDVNAYLATAVEDPTRAHTMGFRIIAERNPELALRLLELEQQGKAIDPFAIMGMMAVHQGNAALEETFSE